MVSRHAYHARVEATPHRLRHTFAHDLVVSGRVPLDVVAMLLGHTTAAGLPRVATTARYTLPGPEDLSRAVRVLSVED